MLALHDEAKAFADETAALRAKDAQGAQVGVARQVIDKLAFATSIKIVMLEGVEVVFIVIVIGASGQMMVPASIGALLALLAVVLPDIPARLMTYANGSLQDQPGSNDALVEKAQAHARYAQWAYQKQWHR